MSFAFGALNVQPFLKACLARVAPWLALLILLVAWPALTHAAQSDQVEVQRAIWTDPTGEARFEDVMQQPFQPAPAIVSRGYKAGATWLRVIVPPSAAESLWVTIQPMYLDDIQLYSRRREADGRLGDWTIRRTGDRFPFQSRELPTLNYSLTLDTSLSESTVFYVRLTTTSTHALYVTVRTQNRALEFEGRTLLWLGVYLGVVLVLAWMSTLRLIITRDLLWALNLAFQMGTLILTLFYLGLASKYLMPDAPQGVDAWMSTVLCGHLFVGLIYYTVFVKNFGAPRWAVLLYACCTLAFPVQLLWIWHGHEQARLAMSLNSNMLLVSTILGSVVACVFKIQDQRLRWMIRILYLTQTLYLMFFVLPLLGLMPMTIWHLYPALLINLFGSVSQHLVLTRRDQLDIEAKRRLKSEVAAAQLTLRAKQEQLAASTSFLSMLLHELKNPLASIRLAVLNLLRQTTPHSPDQLKRLDHIQAAVQGMDRVLDRCRQVDRIESGGWSVQRVEFDALAIVVELIALQDQGRRVEITAPSSLPVFLDEQGFQIVVANLLDNALGYSPAGSKVSLQLQVALQDGAPGRQLLLRIGNTVGKAGPPDPKKLFEKYYRAEGAHQRTGSGLGLYLVKNLVELKGGTISHSRLSLPDGGDQVIFEVRLPCD